jgi:hypothetical protein
MKSALREPLHIPAPRPASRPPTPTENEMGAMIIIAALLNMLGDDQVTLDEADVNIAIRALEQKQLVVAQDDSDKTVTISLEER